MRRTLDCVGMTFGWPVCTASPSPRISQLPFFVRAAAFPLPSPQKWRGTGASLCSAARDEMTPRARVRGLLNPAPFGGVFLLEGSAFDGLAELELLEKTCSVWARYG